MKAVRVKEAKVQSEIVKTLRLLGYLVIHIPNQATHGVRRYSGLMTGAPDLIVLGDNKIWFLEVKTIDGKQSRAQSIVQKLIEDRGFSYNIVRSVEDALKVVVYGEGQ